MAVHRLASCLNVKYLTKPVFQPSYSILTKYSTAQAPKLETSSEGWKTESSRLDSWISSYENFVGLTEVRDAQQKVLEVSASGGERHPLDVWIRSFDLLDS